MTPDLIEIMARAMGYAECPTLWWPGDEGRTYMSVGGGELPCLYEIDAADCAKFRRLARKALSALEAEGWVTVPKQATPEMQIAALNECSFILQGHDADDVWEAMLSARPESSR